VSYDDRDPDLPDPEQDGVLDLDEVLAALAVGRSRGRSTRGRSVPPRPVTVEVFGPEDDAAQRGVRSDDLAEVLGVGGGLDAEEIVRQVADVVRRAAEPSA
jgi:hypothetical protein